MKRILSLLFLGAALSFGQVRVPGFEGSSGGAAVSGPWTLANHQSYAATGGVASISTPAFSSPLTSGSIIVVFVWDGSGNTGVMPPPTDTAGNIYVDSGSGTAVNSSGGRAQVFVARNFNTTLSNVVTASIGGMYYPMILAVEWTGSVASVPVNGHSICAGCGDSAGLAPDNMATSGMTTTADGDLILGLFVTNGHSPFVPGTGYTQIASSSSLFLVEYLTQTTAGPIVVRGTDAWGYGQPYVGLGLALARN